MSHPPSILVVDDSPIIRKLYAAVLKSNGYDVALAEDGRAGVALALEHPFDLILMDISMPEMDGLTAVRTLRTYPALSGIPILALTAATEPEEQEQARQAGFSDVIDKNGARAIFLETVRQWIQSSQ